MRTESIYVMMESEVPELESWMEMLGNRYACANAGGLCIPVRLYRRKLRVITIRQRLDKISGTKKIV